MTREQREELAKLLPSERLKFDEPMSLHSSIGIGGPCEAFAIVENIDELKKIIAWAAEQGIDYRFWGGGSNVLVRDGGIRGIIAKLGNGFDLLKVDRTDDDDIYVTVGASIPTKRLVNFGIENALGGIAGIAGIWGTVGGNLITNAGTSKGSMGDFVEELTIVDKGGRELTMKKAALNFEYRSLKLPRTAAIVRALLRFKRSTREEVEEEIAKMLEKRNSSQPVTAKSLGCIFRNVGKTSAGMLIEEAGFKGVRVGGARVSPVHANFIVNENAASARDITVLINLIRERVKDYSGIVLDTEIEIMGKD